MTRDAEHNYASIQGHMARGAAWMVAMRWSLRLVGLVNTVIIARLLTPADFGVATMAWIVVEFLMTLSEANVDLALLRGNRFSRAYLDTAWTVRLLCGIATTLALVAVAPLAAAYYHDERVEWVIRIIALRALVTGFENIGVLEFRRQLAFAKEYRFWMWRRVLMFGVGLALAFGFRDYRALAIAAPVSGLITVLVSYTMSNYRPRLCLTHWRELWAFSQWVILYNTARFLNGRVDQFVIGGIGSAADTGNYYVAYDTSGLATREVIWPMGRAFTPTLAKIAHDPAEMKKALLGVLGVVAAIALPAGIGTSMVAEDTTLVLLGEQWTQSVEFFRWLAICGAFEAVLLAMETHFIAVGRERTFAAITLAQLAVLVPAVAVAGAVSGIHGVAAIRTLVTAVTVVLMLGVMVRLGWLSWRGLAAISWRPLVAAAAMAAAVAATHGLLGSGRLLSLAQDIGVGMLAYGVALLALWLLCGRPAGTERSILAALSGWWWRRRAV